MSKWVRSGVLEAAPELVAEPGRDYRALARETGLPLRPMAKPDLPIAVDCFVRFLDLAATGLRYRRQSGTVSGGCPAPSCPHEELRRS